MEILNGFASVLEPSVLFFLILGVLIGVAFGAVPGIDIGTGTALLIPLTYGMKPLPALVFLSALSAITNFPF